MDVCADFLLLCMTTFAPRTIENLRSAYMLKSKAQKYE